MCDPDTNPEVLLNELKAQGLFDKIRKDCISNADTKPAYINLNERVERQVENYLSSQRFNPKALNLNSCRERIRRLILDSSYFHSGVDRIVEQVIDEGLKKNLPRVTELVYKKLGYEPKFDPEPQLEPKVEIKKENGNGELKVQTTNLLSSELDLEAVSPDSDKKSVDSSLSKKKMDDETEDLDEEFESPAFEPLEGLAKIDNENSQASGISGISGLTSQDDSADVKSLKNESKADVPDDNESQLSQISSNTRISTTNTTQEANHPAPTPQLDFTEEAQMPKFNENSESATESVNPVPTTETDKKNFDLNNEKYEFTGTERKSLCLEDEEEPKSSTSAIFENKMSVDIDSLYVNEATTDSSENQMQIYLKDESRSKRDDEASISSVDPNKKNENSQSESKIDSSRKDRKDDKKSHSSSDRGRSSYHKKSSHSSSSKRDSHSSSSKVKSSSSISKHESSSKQRREGSKDRDKDKDKDRYKSSSDKIRDSKYSSKSSRDKERDRKDRDKEKSDRDKERNKDRDKDRKSSSKYKPSSESSSKSKEKTDDKDKEKQVDDHQQEKTVKKRRSTDHDSNGGNASKTKPVESKDLTSTPKAAQPEAPTETKTSTDAGTKTTMGSERAPVILDGIFTADSEVSFVAENHKIVCKNESPSILERLLISQKKDTESENSIKLNQSESEMNETPASVSNNEEESNKKLKWPKSPFKDEDFMGFDISVETCTKVDRYKRFLDYWNPPAEQTTENNVDYVTNENEKEPDLPTDSNLLNVSAKRIRKPNNNYLSTDYCLDDGSELESKFKNDLENDIDDKEPEKKETKENKYFQKARTVGLPKPKKPPTNESDAENSKKEILKNQRYSSNDLYKPRLNLSQRRKRPASDSHEIE